MKHAIGSTVWNNIIHIDTHALIRFVARFSLWWQNKTKLPHMRSKGKNEKKKSWIRKEGNFRKLLFSVKHLNRVSIASCIRAHEYPLQSYRDLITAFVQTNGSASIDFSGMPGVRKWMAGRVKGATKWVKVFSTEVYSVTYRNILLDPSQTWNKWVWIPLFA